MTSTVSHTVGVSDSITASASATSSPSASDLTLGRDLELSAIHSGISREAAAGGALGGIIMILFVICFMCSSWRAEVAREEKEPLQLVKGAVDESQGDIYAQGSDTVGDDGFSPQQ